MATSAGASVPPGINAPIRAAAVTANDQPKTRVRTPEG
jgi:hypothetical protein